MKSKTRSNNFTIWVLFGPVIALLLGLNIIEASAKQNRIASGQRQTLMHNGIERSFIVRVPDQLVESRIKLPLVLVLHGGGGNGFNDNVP